MNLLKEDFVNDLVDEIALEGLDGITLQALWLRLNERPGFVVKPSDEHIKAYLWKCIVKIPNIIFYSLPSERANLKLYKRKDYIDELGYFYEPEDMKPCIYPHFPVSEKGILGSCSTYNVRSNISDVARREDYQTVNRRGNTLVIVADQKTRFRAICSNDVNPLIELSQTQYCMLERIGRSRYEGETTQGKRGLQMVTEDPKMLYYFRKLLLKEKLIQKQIFYMKVSKSTSTGSLIHLPRFYSEIKSKQDIDAAKLINFLEEQPTKFSSYKNIRNSLNIELKKLLLKYPKNFKTMQLPYRTVYPKCKPSEWKLKSTGEEKSVRVILLVNSSLIKDDEEEEEDDEEIGLMDESRRRMDRSLIRQAYALVEEAGPRGIKQGALGSLLGLPSLQARSICKHLVKKNLVRTAMIDIGRQRITHFYCRKFDSAETSLTSEVKEERNKLLHAISVNTELFDDGNPKEFIMNKQTDNEIKLNDDELNKSNLEARLNNQESGLNNQNSTHIYHESGLNNQELALNSQKPGLNNQESALNNQELFRNSQESPQKGIVKTEDINQNIEAEIIISKPELSEKSALSLKEEMKSLETSVGTTLTARMLKRASLIVQAVNLHKVIQDTQKVLRIISEFEEAEGMKQTIDRKTIQRLLDKLESDGVLRTIKVNLRGYGKEKSMLFICHPSVNEHHSEIQSAIEQAKMKLPIVSAHHTKKKQKLDLKKSKPIPTPLKYEIRAGRKYGYKPKFLRMRILHTYMFYLIYGYDGDANQDQRCKLEIAEKANVDPSICDEMSFVYRPILDWRMFLPPLPEHAEYPVGWCLLSDVLLRLPLCFFVGIVNVPYDVPGLKEYLEHPIKKFYLVKHLPSEILNHLTIMRKYIFVVSEIVTRLGYIGLIQMGPQKLKEKDQVFIYLNRHALLRNTIPSDVGYNHISSNKVYDVMHYEFNTLEDIEHYWFDLWNFAMNTNLGNRNSMTGKHVVVESINAKKELLLAVQPKTAEDAKACDIGYIPGDNLGAAGLDSDMFVHLKRNWLWTGERLLDESNGKSILATPIKRPLKTPRLKEVSPKPSTSPSTKVAKSREKEQSKNILEINKSRLSKAGTLKSRAIPKKKTRVLLKRKSKFIRKPYYDQIDKEALSRMVKLRVDWTPAEDNLLLICKVASLYMSPDKRRQVAKNFCAVREVLHSTYPAISRNKTSRACQRRMHYMMKNPSTAQSVYYCLEEIKQDPEITEKFDQAVEKLDALIKSQGEGPKGYQNEYDKIFINLVTTLFKKLKTITKNEKIQFKLDLPSSFAEFVKKYNISLPTPHRMRYGSFNEVQKTVDILASVINAVIHSSLCCTCDKTSYSHQLFYIYQQYPDKLLRFVMAKCRSMSMVSCRKRYKRWKSAGNDCLPLASSPYQLSITYVHILQTKYQYSIFSECYEGLKVLLNTPSNYSVESGSNEILPLSKNLEVSSGGGCANIVELFSASLIEMKVEFPDQLIVLDPRLSETEESYKLIMKRFKEMLNIINESRKKDKKTILSDDYEDDDEFIPEKNTIEEKESYCEQFNLKNRTGVANTASRLALYLMRDDPLEHLDKSLQHAHDFFVLNPCKVTGYFDKNKIEELIFYKETKFNTLSEVKRMAIFPEVSKENSEVVNTLEEYPKELALNLLEFLESKGELGATYENFAEKFQHSKVFNNLLTYFVNEQFILKTGSVNVRFIHNKFSKPWLVKSFFLRRHIRDSMDTPSTNSAYAISFGNSDSSVKRKAKTNKIFSESARKKIKVCSSSSNNKDIEPLPSTSKENDNGKLCGVGSKNDIKDLDETSLSKHSNAEENSVSLSQSCDQNETNSSYSRLREDSEKGIVGHFPVQRNTDELISSSRKRQKGIYEPPSFMGDLRENNGTSLERRDVNVEPQASKQTGDGPTVIDYPIMEDSAYISTNKEQILDPELFVDFETDNIKDSVKIGSENSPEAEQSSRFVMKTTSKRWVPIPSENMKKFTDLDSMDTENIFVKVRPWIKIDGTLNRRVLDRLLGSVLGHCLTCPGIPLKNMQDRFVPALQPAHTYELLEILVKLECIKFIEINRSHKCSLFSRRVRISTGPPPGIGVSKDIIIEPEPLAVSRLGYFIGDKTYTFDYLEALSKTKFP